MDVTMCLSPLYVVLWLEISGVFTFTGPQMERNSALGKVLVGNPQRPHPYLELISMRFWTLS
jgi:hypothetical protein